MSQVRKAVYLCIYVYIHRYISISMYCTGIFLHLYTSISVPMGKMLVQVRPTEGMNLHHNLHQTPGVEALGFM